MIHQYTTIENLALILQSKKIRFSRLDSVDDLKEIVGLPRKFGTYVYISCWTYDEEESIPLWKMYTQNMKGVRISFPKEMFNMHLIKAGDIVNPGFDEDYKSPLPFEEIMTENYMITNYFPNTESFYKEVIYDDNFSEIYKNIFTEENGIIKYTNLYTLGKYKRKNWGFQKECRFTLYVFPLLPLNHPLINGDRSLQYESSGYLVLNNIENNFKYLDIDLNDNILDCISLRLGPLCTDSDAIIVDSLLKTYTNNGKFVRSNLADTIRK